MWRPMTLSIVVADDHPIVRKGLHVVLEAEPGWTILAEARDGLEATNLVERLQPDVLVLDLMMSGLNGLDALPIIRQRAPRTRVVVFSMVDTDSFISEALRNGAL